MVIRRQFCGWNIDDISFATLNRETIVWSVGNKTSELAKSFIIPDNRRCPDMLGERTGSVGNFRLERHRDHI